MTDVAPEGLRADHSTTATLRSSPGARQHPTEDGKPRYRKRHVPPCSIRDRSPGEVAERGGAVDGDEQGDRKPTCMPTGTWSVRGLVACHSDKVLGSHRSRTGAAPPCGAPALAPRSARRVGITCRTWEQPWELPPRITGRGGERCRTVSPGRAYGPGRSGTARDHGAEGVGFGKRPRQRRCC